MRLVAIIIFTALVAVGQQEKTSGEPPAPRERNMAEPAMPRSEDGVIHRTLPSDIAKPEVPQALSCMEPAKDFGMVDEGQKLTHTFIVGNASREVVEVDRVASSCGCVVTARQKFRLGPDEGEEVAISLDTMGYGGTKVEKTISVHEKGDAHPPLVLTVKAQVKGIPPEKRVIFTPKDKAIDGDPNKRHTLYLQVPTDPNITFTVQPPEWLNFSTLKSKRQNVADVVMWEVEIWPAKRLRERMMGELVVNSNCPKFEKVAAAIQVVPRPAFMFDPYMLTFDRAESSQTKTLTIRSGDCRVEAVGSSIEVRPSNGCLRVKRVGNTSDSEIRLEIENAGCGPDPARLEVLLGKETVGTVPILFN
jgi:hypothetical protein